MSYVEEFIKLNEIINSENYFTRITIYILGSFIMTLGISMSVKSDFGVSPVSSIPYTITCITGLEMGKATILFHIGLVVMQASINWTIILITYNLIF